jgi:hypothetical protein
MPKYSVLIPFTGSMYAEVEADNPEAAKEAAFEVKFDIDSIHELEFHDHVVRGNVFYGVKNSMEVELIDDEQNQRLMELALAKEAELAPADEDPFADD